MLSARDAIDARGGGFGLAMASGSNLVGNRSAKDIKRFSGLIGTLEAVPELRRTSKKKRLSMGERDGTLERRSTSVLATALSRSGICPGGSCGWKRTRVTLGHGQRQLEMRGIFCGILEAPGRRLLYPLLSTKGDAPGISAAPQAVGLVQGQHATSDGLSFYLVILI